MSDMEPILEYIEREFGEHGVRAAGMLWTAEALLAAEIDAPRLAETVAYCLREALVGIPQAAELERGEWTRISREVVEARRRFDHVRGLSGMDQEHALEELLDSIKNLEAFHEGNQIHVEGLSRIIKARTGADPISSGSTLLGEYQQLIKNLHEIVHRSASDGPGTLEEVRTCRDQAVDLLRRLFLIDDRLEQIEELAAIEHPTLEDAESLQKLLSNEHDLRFFATRAASPEWLNLLLGYGLLDPPTDQGAVWPVLILISRFRDSHPEILSNWLDRVWDRWSTEERGLIALATAAHQVGEHGHPTLLQCLKKRPDLSILCRYAVWTYHDLDATHRVIPRIADLLLNPAASADQYDIEDLIPSKLVAGITKDNALERVTLLARKVRLHIMDDPLFFLDPYGSIGARQEHPHINTAASLMDALVESLRKAKGLQFSTNSLVTTIQPLPKDLGTRFQAWLSTQADDIGCEELIEFVSRSIGSREPTGDALLLVDAIQERCAGTSFVDAWKSALGDPPDAIELGRLVGEKSIPEEVIRRWRWSVVLPSEASSHWEDCNAILRSALGPLDRDTFREPGIRAYTLSGPNSPFTTNELGERPPDEAARKIASWRPTERDRWDLLSARGVGRQLEELVKNNASAWVIAPVRMVADLRHPMYVSHYFRGLAAAAKELDSAGDDLVRVVEFVRTHPWPAAPLGGDDFDYDPDWRQADAAGIDLIEALVRNKINLGEAAGQQAWTLVLGAVRDRDEPSSILSQEDPLTLAINRPCTQALETMLYLVEHEYQQSKPIPGEVLATLTEVLTLAGQDGVQHRAILAPRIPFLRNVLPGWLEANLNLFLGKDAPEDLAQQTIDLALKWGRPDRWLLEHFRAQILDAVERDVERALEGFLLGMFWGVTGYDVASCVKALADQGPKYVSEAGEAAARMLRHDDTPDDVIERGVAFWEEAIRLQMDAQGFHGFGWWAEITQLDPDQWESLMLETCEKANGRVDWARRVAERAASRPMSDQPLGILTYLVRAPLEIWDQSEVAQQALAALKESQSAEGVSEARTELRRALLERGHFDARDL